MGLPPPPPPPHNFIIVWELGRFTGTNEVNKKYGEVKNQNFNIICAYVLAACMLGPDKK